MNAIHPQLPIGLRSRCWALPAFSDQELVFRVFLLVSSSGSIRYLTVTRCCQKTGMNELVGIHVYLKIIRWHKAPGHNEKSMPRKL